MASEQDPRFQACRSRDKRFDGQFVVAVTSTKIYCRPSCPAVAPKPENVRFYATAAAAQGGGFRACLRCHPDAAPGAPGWNLRGDVAARAMSLIADGVVDREGVAGLAARVSYSERHLHRQLVAELGASPLALARAQRAQTARMLIETTELRMIDVAFASGFASVRQFNETIAAIFARTPSELRRHSSVARAGTVPATGLATAGTTTGPANAGTANGATANGSPAPLTVRLAYREPFDWDQISGFLGARAIPGVEELVEGTYRRTLRLPNGAGVVELSDGGGYVSCELYLSELMDLAAAVGRCRRLLDLDADPAVPASHLSLDRALKGSVERSPGLRVPGSVDGAELAVRAVLGQQVSVGAARTLAARLAQELGEPVVDPREWGTLTRLFPSANAIAQVGLDMLPGPGRRRATLHALASALAGGEIAIDGGSDRERTRDRLQAIAGIGPWTAEYIAMRGLGDPDAFIAGDLGVSRGVAALEAEHGGRLDAARTTAWRPWRSYAVMHLWQAASRAPALAREART